MQIIGFRRFQAARAHRKALIIHNVPESFLPNFALADMRMAIDTRSQIGFRIIQVKRQYLFAAHKRFHLADSCFPAFL
jgi:hypothetical protein